MTPTRPNTINKKYVNDLTYEVLGAAIEVHRYAGPSLLESIYQKFLEQELQLRGINFY